MSNLPIEINDKLNIFQKLRIRMYLLGKYSSSRFNNAPEYIKQDERVLRKRIKGEQSIGFYRNQELIELFKNNSNIILTSNETIIDTIHLKGFETKRPIMPQTKYLLPTNERTVKEINEEKMDQFINNYI